MKVKLHQHFYTAIEPNVINFEFIRIAFLNAISINLSEMMLFGFGNLSLDNEARIIFRILNIGNSIVSIMMSALIVLYDMICI